MATDQVVILNPASGSGDHALEIRDRSKDTEYDVRETTGKGDAVALAREAANEGATLVIAAGGDGTVNEVLRGVVAASALDRVTFGVVPCGTGNNFAGNIGVLGIDHAFQVIRNGDKRQIDLGMADDRPFVNSCVGGLTATASENTTPELKAQLGTFAYVLTTLRTIPTFDGIRVSIDAYLSDSDSPTWSGSVVAVLIGNARRFSSGGRTQSNMEDGLFDVTLIHDTGSIDLMEKAVIERLLGRDTDGTTRFEVPTLEIDVAGGPISFSLDGEIIERHRLSLNTRSRVVRIAVGEQYDPDPGGSRTTGGENVHR